MKTLAREWTSPIRNLRRLVRVARRRPILAKNTGWANRVGPRYGGLWKRIQRTVMNLGLSVGGSRGPDLSWKRSQGSDALGAPREGIAVLAERAALAIQVPGVRRLTGCALVMTAALASSSCFLGHKQHTRVFIPPQPPPPVETADIPRPDLPSPPDVDARPAAPDGTKVPDTVELTPPPPPPPRRPTPPPAPRTQASIPTPEPPPPPPRLGQIFTAGQLRDYNRSLRDSLARVDRALIKLEGKRLSPEQNETADRIRTFRKQAEQAREQDLVTAVSLAKRADLLAKDLLERLP